MTALKRQQKQSKRERENSALISQTVVGTMEIVLCSAALTMNEKDHYGEKRITDRITDIVNRVDEYTERYGSECVLTAMKKKLKDLGITIEIEGK